MLFVNPKDRRFRDFHWRLLVLLLVAIGWTLGAGAASAAQPRTVVVIDYAFQPNKTRDLTTGVRTGTITLRQPEFGYRFAEGTAHRTSDPDDLRFEDRNGQYSFHNFHAGPNNGFYDAGDVSLDSVKEAAGGGYNTASKPCIVGHTYVVRTAAGEYVKFRVKSVERTKVKNGPATVHGIVTDEEKRPVADVIVRLSAGGVSKTDEKGAYSIAVPDSAKVNSIEFRAGGSDLEEASQQLELQEGDRELNVTLFASRIVVIDYVFQPNKTRDLVTGATTGTIKLARPNFGYLFAQGIAHATSEPDDLRFVGDNGEWFFRNFHVGAFYDAGDVPLDSIKEAAETGYNSSRRPCIVGHTYVVRTAAKQYVKFRVKSLEKYVVRPGPATVQGTVVDEDNLPVPQARVRLTDSKGKGTPEVETDARGAFRIVAENPTEILEIEMTWQRSQMTTKRLGDLNGGDVMTVNLTAYSPRRIVVEFAYQPDGSPRFTEGAATGTMTVVPRTGFYFSKGEAQPLSPSADLSFSGENNVWKFYSHNGKLGPGRVYDAGEVALASVTEAGQQNRFSDRARPCVVGHTYVVRTLDDKYAKFYVKSMERMAAPPPAVASPPVKTNSAPAATRPAPGRPVPARPVPPVAVVPKSRVWKDKTGTFQVEAELVEATADLVRLKTAAGKTIEVPIAELSLDDRAFLAARKKNAKPEESREARLKRLLAEGAPIAKALAEQQTLDVTGVPVFEAIPRLFKEQRQSVAFVGDRMALGKTLVTLKQTGTREQLLAAICAQGKVDWDVHSEFLVYGDADRLKALRAQRARFAQREKELQGVESNQYLLQRMRKIVTAEFLEVRTSEAIAFLQDIVGVLHVIEQRDGVPTQLQSIEVKLPFDAVLSLMAAQAKAEWTTDGNVVYYGTPSRIAAMEKMIAGRSQRRQKWSPISAKILEIPVRCEHDEEPLSKVCTCLASWGQPVPRIVPKMGHENELVTFHSGGRSREYALDILCFQNHLAWTVDAAGKIEISKEAKE